MYHFSIQLNIPFDLAVEKTIAALKQEDFGVLTKIDVKATMKAKLNLDKRPYLILGACNPKLANRALEAEPNIGVLLPCNVVVSEEADGKIIVTFLNPDIMSQLINNPEVKEIAKEARTRLERVRDVLSE